MISFMLNHDFQTAVKVLNDVRPDIMKTNDTRLKILWKTNMAIALERLDKLNEAESYLVEVIFELETIGADTNLPRAYSVMGQIYEKRADLDSVLETTLLHKATEFYQKQFDVGQTLHKTTDMSEALQYMGGVYIKLGELELARKSFIESIRLSRETDIPILTFRSEIGLAKLIYITGNQTKACSLSTELSQRLDVDKSLILNPTSRSFLDELKSLCLID